MTGHERWLRRNRDARRRAHERALASLRGQDRRLSDLLAQDGCHCLACRIDAELWT